MNTTTFETGATSAAVNELILYTDNTKELAELRDSIYESFILGPTFYDFAGLILDAKTRYKKEMGKDHWNENDISRMSLAQNREYCQLYANRFAEWKKERERNSK